MFSEFFDKLLKRDQPNSRSEVKQRLQLLLAHDRSDLTPQTLEAIRKEIVAVVSKYVEIDDEGLEFMLESDQRLSALVVNFPIRRIRDEDEQRQPVKTTAQPIVLDEEQTGESSDEEAEIFQMEDEHQAGKPGKAAEEPLVEPPPEVQLGPNDSLPEHMTLDDGPELGSELDPEIGSTPAS